MRWTVKNVVYLIVETIVATIVFFGMFYAFIALSIILER